MQRAGKLANAISEIRRATMGSWGWWISGEKMKKTSPVIELGLYTLDEMSTRGVALLLDRTVADCVTSIKRHKDKF